MPCKYMYRICCMSNTVTLYCGTVYALKTSFFLFSSCHTVISGNRFDKFPKQVLNYHNIVTLNFHNNALRHLPAELTKLRQLRNLDLR